MSSRRRPGPTALDSAGRPSTYTRTGSSRWSASTIATGPRTANRRFAVTTDTKGGRLSSLHSDSPGPSMSDASRSSSSRVEVVMATRTPSMAALCLPSKDVTSPETMNKGGAVHVMIVEDHELLAESLRLALCAEGLTVTVARTFAMDEILDSAAAEKPDVVLLDLDLGQDDLDGSMLIEPL